MSMSMMCFNSILLSSKTLGGSKWVASLLLSTPSSRVAAASTSKAHRWGFHHRFTPIDKKLKLLVKAKANQQEEEENYDYAIKLDLQSEKSTASILKGNSSNPLNNSNSNDEEEEEVSSNSGGEEVWSKKRMGSKRRRRQVIRRSGLLAKQVISIQSALSLGFVAQLWVDTSSWVVLVVEVRHNLLSGESETFLLCDITQVGDVVLVQDDFVLDTQLPMLGLHSLVGYRVVTPNRQTIGKVRGYSFNIESGAVESLELDSFGISIIPSSLVSTYRLLVEDVMEVMSDTVIVHEAAASHIQRLTKGFWDTQKSESSMYEVDECSADGNSTRADQNISPWKSQKFRPSRKPQDDWELPKDYL